MHTTTPKCVLIHFGFHWILNEFEHFYHGEIGQPPSEQGLIDTNSELVHWYLVKQGYFKVKYNFTKPFTCWFSRLLLWWTQLWVQMWRQWKEKELGCIPWWRTPKLLDGLNCESRARSLACNISGVEGCAEAPGWD
jgi:hypothetical protein